MDYTDLEQLTSKVFSSKKAKPKVTNQHLWGEFSQPVAWREQEERVVQRHHPILAFLQLYASVAFPWSLPGVGFDTCQNPEIERGLITETGRILKENNLKSATMMQFNIINLANFHCIRRGFFYNTLLANICIYHISIPSVSFKWLRVVYNKKYEIN